MQLTTSILWNSFHERLMRSAKVYSNKFRLWLAKIFVFAFKTSSCGIGVFPSNQEATWLKYCSKIRDPCPHKGLFPHFSKYFVFQVSANYFSLPTRLVITWKLIMRWYQTTTTRPDPCSKWELQKLSSNYFRPRTACDRLAKTPAVKRQWNEIMENHFNAA